MNNINTNLNHSTLPIDALSEIYEYLSVSDRVSYICVSKEFRKVGLEREEQDFLDFSKISSFFQNYLNNYGHLDRTEQINSARKDLVKDLSEQVGNIRPLVLAGTSLSRFMTINPTYLYLEHALDSELFILPDLIQEQKDLNLIEFVTFLASNAYITFQGVDENGVVGHAQQLLRDAQFLEGIYDENMRLISTEIVTLGNEIASLENLSNRERAEGLRNLFRNRGIYQLVNIFDFEDSRMYPPEVSLFENLDRNLFIKILQSSIRQGNPASYPLLCNVSKYRFDVNETGSFFKDALLFFSPPVLYAFLLSPLYQNLDPFLLKEAFIYSLSLGTHDFIISKMLIESSRFNHLEPHFINASLEWLILSINDGNIKTISSSLLECFFANGRNQIISTENWSLLDYVLPSEGPCREVFNQYYPRFLRAASTIVDMNLF